MKAFIDALLIIIITSITCVIIIITVNIAVTNTIIINVIIIVPDNLITIMITTITDKIIIIIAIVTVRWDRQLEHFIEEIAEEMTQKYWSPALLTGRSGR